MINRRNFFKSIAAAVTGVFMKRKIDPQPELPLELSVELKEIPTIRLGEWVYINIFFSGEGDRGDSIKGRFTGVCVTTDWKDQPVYEITIDPNQDYSE